MKILKFPFLILVVFVSLLSLVFALHVVTTSTGGTTYSINESVETVFNISINNTNTTQASNITTVNITLPSEFTFTLASNGSNASISTFSNASNVLTWTNGTGATVYIINGSEQLNFWFNATVSKPGDYNIIVNTSSNLGSYGTNISVEVNDTTNPTASLGTNPIDYYNSSSATVVFDIKGFDGYSIQGMKLWGNWSGSWAVNHSNASIVNNTFSNISLYLSDGSYVWGVFVNDTANNTDWSANRTLVVDTVDPTPSASCTKTDLRAGEEITCTCAGTDTASGINSSATTASSSPDTSDLSGAQTYTCSVKDYAGNTASDTFTYIVVGGGTPSGGNGGGPSLWTGTTYSVSDEQFEQGYTQAVAAKSRVKVKVENDYHHVGVKELTETTATIEISSDPIEVELDVGEDIKVDMTDDNFYDIYVILNSITNNKANLTVQKIHEEIPEGQEPVETTGEIIEPEGKDLTWLWIVIGVLVLAAIIGGGIAVKKKRKQ